MRSLDQTSKGIKSLQNELGRLGRRQEPSEEDLSRMAEIQEILGPERGDFAQIQQQVNAAKRSLGSAERDLNQLIAMEEEQESKPPCEKPSPRMRRHCYLDAAFRAGRPELTAARFTDIQPFADNAWLSWTA